MKCKYPIFLFSIMGLIALVACQPSVKLFDVSPSRQRFVVRFIGSYVG